MPLHLITGRANAGKTGALYGELEATCRRGACPTLLVPVSQDVWRATAELADRGIRGVKIAALDAWIAELWALYGDGRRLVGEASRLSLLSVAIARCELDVLRRSSAYPGFIGLMADVARRLTTPAVESNGGPASGEAKAVLVRYSSLLQERQLVEYGTAAIQVASRVPAQSSTVFVNRFTDFSAAQEAFLLGLSGESDVVVALPWEAGFPATEALTPLVGRLSAAAESVRHEAAPVQQDALGSIEADLYGQASAHTASEQLVFAVATGDEAECILAARLAADAAARGIPPENIAIVFRDVGRRAGLLVAALSAVGLAVEVDSCPRLPGTSLGRAFLGLIEACLEPTREGLLAWALSPYAGAAADDVAAADSRWREERLSGDALLHAASADLGSAGTTVGLACSLARDGVRTENLGEWRALASQLLGSAAHVHGLENAGGALDAAAHRAIVSAVVDLANSDPNATTSELLRVLRRTTVATRPAERSGAVQIADAQRIRGRRFDVVILGGLTASEFAADKEPALAARVLAALGEPPGTEEVLSERLLFYLLVSRARRELVLLRQVADAAGEAQRACAFWDEVIDVFREPSGEELPEFPAGARVERLGIADDLVAAAPAFQRGRSAQRAKAAQIAPIRVERGRLRDLRVFGLLAATTEFSVTELEVYGQCPYRWFYDRALKPRELDPEIDARERGSYAHRLMHEFYRTWAHTSGATRITPGSLGDALRVFDEAEQRVRSEMRMKADSLEEELDLARAAEWARSVVRDDATFLQSFEPVAHEFVFGSNAGVPVHVGGVALRGSIDRVERGGAGVVAIDYKSSKDVRGHASFATHGLIQAPVYAMAASQAFDAPVVGGLYRSLRSLRTRGFYLAGSLCLEGRGGDRDELAEESLNQVLDRATHLVAQAASGIRAGDIAPRPSRKSCAICGARKVCGEAV